MARTIEQAFQQTICTLDDAVSRLSMSVPRPSRVTTASGSIGYRYQEASIPQAIVLKTVRMVSGLRALKVLLDSGLVLDAGAAMRVLDEIGSEIMFLAGPVLSGSAPEPRHSDFLAEFFQEEFDNPDPVKSSQRRRRVPRRDVRAYVARTFNVGAAISDVVAISETIDNAFSGYVHGAAVHTMDIYDGIAFRLPIEKNEGPSVAVRQQFPNYMHRALINANMAAKAVGDEDLFKELYSTTTSLFSDEGRVR